MFCVPDKQVRILKLIMEFHARALEIIRLGAPLLKIRALPVLDKIVRAKSQVPNDDAQGLPALAAELSAEMEELARSYRR
jgi:V/A-type H+-transporting ATPase subunit A